MLLEGATDHHVVEAYVKDVLIPTLRPGQVVVLDNLSAHKRAKIEPLLRAVGCDLWFLPPYSPDLAPIELAFAKIKQAVRDLDTMLLTLEAKGDYAGATRLLDNAKLRPELAKALAKLTDLPVDIAPRYVTADALSPRR